MSVLIFLFVVLKNMQTLVLAGEKKKKRSNSNLGNTGLENLSIQYFVFSI